MLRASVTAVCGVSFKPMRPLSGVYACTSFGKRMMRQIPLKHQAGDGISEPSSLSMSQLFSGFDDCPSKFTSSW